MEDFQNWTQTTKYQQGNDYYHHNGAGEMLVFSAADFEDFLQPRPDLSQNGKSIRASGAIASTKSMAISIHATYDESIMRFNVYEKINKNIPINQLNWFFDHAETISDQSIERVKKLGGHCDSKSHGISRRIFFDLWAKTNVTNTTLQKFYMQVPVGMGTDATRVSSYNPWLCLYWLVSGKTVGGTKLYNEENIISREKAIELYTKGSAWFSNEEHKKGSFIEGQLADFAVLSKDFFKIPDEEIKDIYSIMTVVGGEIVHASDEFSQFNPPIPLVSPDWSPIITHGTYGGNRNLFHTAHNHLNKNYPHFHHIDCLCGIF